MTSIGGGDPFSTRLCEIISDTSKENKNSFSHKMIVAKMTSNSSLPLVTVSTPLVVLHASILSSIQFPRDWCDKPRDLGSCMCEEQHDVLVTDISHAGEVIDSDNETLQDAEDDPARLVDWWTEGVVLPSICAIGILGKFFTSTTPPILFILCPSLRVQCTLIINF